MGTLSDSPLPPADWAAVARAAADARRLREDGLASCYGDTSLWASAASHVLGGLERAIRTALDGAPGCPGDLVDALQAGDRDLEGLVLDEILEDLRSRQDAMRRLLRDGG